MTPRKTKRVNEMKLCPSYQGRTALPLTQFDYLTRPRKDVVFVPSVHYTGEFIVKRTLLLS